MKVHFLTSAFDNGFPNAFIRELKRYVAPINRQIFGPHRVFR